MKKQITTVFFMFQRIYKVGSLVLFALLLLVGCAPSKDDGLAMATSNTIPVDEDDTKDSIVLKAAHVVPTPNQMEALKDEYIAFIHFGPNTFTRMEWGNGMEDPKIFALEELDTDQWCEAMKAAGMTKVIITVKHHDGFVLWQSRYTEHGVMSSPFRDGKGDILKDLSESCEKYGLKLGVYLSPADLFQIESPTGLYGNLSEYTKRTIPRPVEGRPFANKTTFEFEVDDYNEYFLNQLFELLTEYGPVHEVWFDGAHPKRKGGQQYNYLAWKELIRTLAPEAVVFGKEDIRWCGNEAGKTRDTEWNVVPYKEDPALLNRFADITSPDVGSRKKLYEGKFLHYQPAETNTSIREGWFYRDEDKQRVRSADDVFDIYERSVGGNSIFLLNIPPNREGKFSPEDVAVLHEVGERIQKTYGQDLAKEASGPDFLLDGNIDTYSLVPRGEAVEVWLPKEQKVNRFVIQEAVATHGERVEEHALDAWLNGKWEEVASATNIGYKRILRFPAINTNKFRVRVKAARYVPALAEVSVHYYTTRPPQLVINRSVDGNVDILPKKADFGWKPHGEDSSGNINTGYTVHYTTDGSEPDASSPMYSKAFKVEEGTVKAVAVANGAMGSVASRKFGLVKKDWRLLGADSQQDKRDPDLAWDANAATYWESTPSKGGHYIEIDLGAEHTLTGFEYTPQTRNGKGMIEQGVIKASADGKRWKSVTDFEFGNLINDPTPRAHSFEAPVSTRYIRVESKRIAGDGATAAIAELEFFVSPL